MFANLCQPLITPSFSSVQFISVAQSCPTLCDPVNHSTPGLPVHHQLPGFTQTHVRQVSDAIQPSHPRSSPSPSAPNPSQHQSLFQWVNSSHEVGSSFLHFQCIDFFHLCSYLKINFLKYTIRFTVLSCKTLRILIYSLAPTVALEKSVIPF